MPIFKDCRFSLSHPIHIADNTFSIAKQKRDKYIRLEWSRDINIYRNCENLSLHSPLHLAIDFTVSRASNKYKTAKFIAWLLFLVLID